MHFSVLLIHENDESYIMGKRSHEATEDEGAEISINVEFTARQAAKLYKDAIKEDSSIESRFPTLSEYMEVEYSHLTEQDGKYGYSSNSLGMYDWYEVGGRWSNMLPTCKNEKELKRLVDKALNIKDKKIAEKYRDNLDEYIKISEMPLMDACGHLNIGGQNEMLISKDISAQDIINWWKAKDKISKDDEDDVIGRIITSSVIIEEDGEEEVIDCSEMTDEIFIEKYNYFLKLNKKGREFKLTILDCHS
jgi:hypothetical protein